MRLNETEMVKLLPAWMQEDGGDKGLATGCDIISRDAYARLKLLSRWDKIDQLSDAELDEMAWELNIQWYDSTAPIAAKRAVIRNSDRVYAKLGTPYAVEQIVADYFGTGEVREWYQYGGQPHHFKVLSDNPSLVNSNLDLFLFLSTPSARRATAKTETKSLFSNKLYNILHEFRRALIYNGSKNYPNHAKRLENPVRRCRKDAEDSPFAPGRKTQNNSRPSCSKGG